MSRQGALSTWVSSPRNLRLGALMLIFVAINQIDDPMIDATVAQELLYWCVRICALASGLWIADALVARLAVERWSRPAWLRPVLVVSALGLLPFSFVEILVEPYLPMRPEYVDDELWAMSPFLAWLSEYATVLSIFVPIHLLLWLILQRPVPDSPVDDVDAAQELPAFLQSSSVRAFDELYALEAEEHYVRVHSKHGTDLVHHRFGDAADAMPAALGLRTHRSWWVANEAVVQAERGSRRWKLKLPSDVLVPVSDSYVAAVRERGWLKRKSRA